MGISWRLKACAVATAAAALITVAAATERQPTAPPQRIGVDTRTANAQQAAEPPLMSAAAERGRSALLERCFSDALVSRSSYETLWKQWDLTARPDDFDAQVRERYGLHEAPYPNDGLPMGLRTTTGSRGARAVGIDCMLCHGGSIFGKSVIGVPNTSIDLAGLFRDLDRAGGGLGVFPYRLSNVRGTTESTATAVFLISVRDEQLNHGLPNVRLWPVPDQSCEDPPAWWLLKRKRTMYHNGQIDARAVRPLMTFMLGPADLAMFEREEKTFADIREFLTTLAPPKYPLPVDAGLASRGRIVFEENCSTCHGTCGPGGERSYPNKIVPLKRIGTDPSLVRGLTPAIEDHFRRSWFTGELGADGKRYPLRYNAGYQAPPLDGIWATAPYLHNGSVPTLHHLLKSSERPRVFTRSFKTDREDYDAERVGWKVTEVASDAPRPRSPADARRIYDTSEPGRGNAGHTFGDDLTDDERRAVIEFLKTL